MDPGTSTDIDTAGMEPVIEERRTGDGVPAVRFARGSRRDDGGEQDSMEPESHIILGED